MTKYVQLRMGLGGSRATAVAYLILKKQAKEGMPTESSKQFSQSGKRIEAMKDSFQQNEEKYSEIIDSKVANVLDAEFSTIQSQTF